MENELSADSLRNVFNAILILSTRNFINHHFIGLRLECLIHPKT